MPPCCTSVPPSERQLARLSTQVTQEARSTRNAAEGTLVVGILLCVQGRVGSAACLLAVEQEQVDIAILLLAVLEEFSTSVPPCNHRNIPHDVTSSLGVALQQVQTDAGGNPSSDLLVG